jgi:hypothetical protein
MFDRRFIMCLHPHTACAMNDIKKRARNAIERDYL